MERSKQNIAIAKLMGWDPTCGSWVKNEAGDTRVITSIDCLNYMHRVWLRCIMGNPIHHSIYRTQLQYICLRDKDEVGFNSITNATAEQRCEAILRTFNKWEEGE